MTAPRVGRVGSPPAAPALLRSAVAIKNQMLYGSPPAPVPRSGVGGPPVPPPAPGSPPGGARGQDRVGEASDKRSLAQEVWRPFRIPRRRAGVPVGRPGPPPDPRS
jgi:hypothetical protein